VVPANDIVSVDRVAWSPDDGTLGILADHRLRTWNLATGDTTTFDREWDYGGNVELDVDNARLTGDQLKRLGKSR
jgi:hypothetical protein